MAKDTAEGAPAGLAGWLDGLRRLKRGSLTPPWPRLRLGRPRITRLRLAVLGVAAALLLLWGAVAVRSTSTYSAQVLVAKGTAIGIPPPNDLDFGDVPRGTPTEKQITFENSGRVPTGVVILEWGSIRDLLKIGDAFFILDPGDEKKVSFKVAPPASAEAKKYSGRVIVVRVPWWWPW